MAARSGVEYHTHTHTQQRHTHVCVCKFDEELPEDATQIAEAAAEIL